ncbi:MAG: GntP family permease [Candidatus Contendobacter sp.]|jgi:GntP family gluconate:H+ symporter|nr:GntP family permease [Candidatus Contendobacter sp.]
MQETVSGTQMLLGLGIGIFVLVFLILKTKVHAFLALIIAAALTGVIGGMPTPAVIKSITTGFGNTLGSIGIVIGFGVMMGQILEVTGAAKRLAYSFLRIFGRGREEGAMAATGYVTSIPIFCDSGFVILSPIAKALSRASGKSVIAIGIALAFGLVATHHAVPPTPGPLGVAGIFKVDVGQMILWGLALALPLTVANLFYARWIGKRIYQIPAPTGDGWIRVKDEAEARQVLGLDEKGTTTSNGNTFDDEAGLPSAFQAFAPIIVPLALIFANTYISAVKLQGLVAEIFLFLGSPIIAVAIGLLLAIYLVGNKMSRKDIIKVMEDGIKSAGIILLVTGGGGALGQVLRDSKTGDYIAQLISQTAIPAVLLPFFVATFVRLVQGSGTVAMITSASITAPILANSGVNPVLAAQAATLGAMVFSYFNDSYFWVVNRMLGIDEVKDQIRVWSVPTTIGWGLALVLLTVLSFIVPVA